MSLFPLIVGITQPIFLKILNSKAKLGESLLILGRPWLVAANAHINYQSGNMIISNGEKIKELTLYPLAQPLLATKDLTWFGSDLDHSIPVLTIGHV